MKEKEIYVKKESKGFNSLILDFSIVVVKMSRGNSNTIWKPGKLFCL